MEEEKKEQKCECGCEHGECNEKEKNHDRGEMKKRFKEKIERKEQEVEELKKDVEHWKNEYYLAYADTQNLRRNLEKDHHEAMRYRSEGFLEKLLPVVDSFNMALQNKPDNELLRNYLTGFEFIYKNLVEAIESEGAKEIKPKTGDKFDSKTMHAIDVEETDGEPDLITKVYSVGMKLHDRIIRPAMVVVSKTKSSEEIDQSQASEKTDA
jgi:molecular chaperone GrpE